MAHFRVAVQIDAAPSDVWELLRDWEGSARWMVDATTVEVLGARREGPGTVVRAVTRIAGFPLTDVMVVTAWEPQRRLEVLHVGWPIKGPAWFELHAQDGGTWFEWIEELTPPLGALGEWGAAVLRGPIERVLGRSLSKLKALVIL